MCWVFVSVRGLSLVVASGGHSSSWCAGLSLSRPLVAEHRLQMRRLSSCGSWAHLLRGMWDLPRPGLKPVSPALAGRFSTTAPPGKPYPFTFNIAMSLHLEWISYRQHVIRSCFFIQSDNFCLLIEMFRPFMLNIIINMVAFNLPSFYLFSICLSFLFTLSSLRPLFQITWDRKSVV